MSAPETEIARDLARRAVIVAPIFAAVLGVWSGPGAAIAVLLAAAVVALNFLLGASMIDFTARISISAIMVGALGGFIVRLGLITFVGLSIKQIEWVDFAVFAVSLIVAHLGLLFWEMRALSMTLAAPGLTPKEVR